MDQLYGSVYSGVRCDIVMQIHNQTKPIQAFDNDVKYLFVCVVFWCVECE